ncbi:hypothetical protein E2C01_094463 [Portunus trituberculatus]|uniref:Uncharacterized protein n=1 Tax=Portunus trituberculatus TaxID=210409 RepID=A0A5B7K1Q5_PORTR|nr:hypothetical protein [Portunus trituberculatus]
MPSPSSPSHWSVSYGIVGSGEGWVGWMGLIKVGWEFIEREMTKYGP